MSAVSMAATMAVSKELRRVAQTVARKARMMAAVKVG